MHFLAVLLWAFFVIMLVWWAVSSFVEAIRKGLQERRYNSPKARAAREEEWRRKQAEEDLLEAQRYARQMEEWHEMRLMAYLKRLAATRYDSR